MGESKDAGLRAETICTRTGRILLVFNLTPNNNRPVLERMASLGVADRTAVLEHIRKVDKRNEAGVPKWRQAGNADVWQCRREYIEVGVGDSELQTGVRAVVQW